MISPPLDQDEWMMQFVAEMTARGLPETKPFITAIARELYPAMGHLSAAQASVVAYVQMMTPAEGVLEERERFLPE